MDAQGSRAAWNRLKSRFGLSRPNNGQAGRAVLCDQFNNRVIRVNPSGVIVAAYGLPLAGGGAIGNNVGYDLHTTQNGLYAPYDAKVIGDYTGLTPPFDFDHDADN